MRKADLTGRIFGKLKVISQAPSKVGPSGCKYTMWFVECECGVKKAVHASLLVGGKAKSCGCIASERMTAWNTTHGQSRSRLYTVWNDMKQRTTNPKARCYERYGGRGITVCDEWRNNFSAFSDWAMANGYNPDAAKGQCTLDRIDNDKGYSPDNCRWTSAKVQAQNRSKAQNGR